MLNIDDLRTICPVCKGAGFIQDSDWAMWWAENDRVPPQGHRLLTIQEEIPCEKCDEIGYIPTEQGRAILEFMILFRGRK